MGITRYFVGKYLKFTKLTGLQKHAEDTNSVAKSTSMRSFISLKIASAFKGSIVFSKKEFRDNSVAVLKDIAAAFIGMVTSAWVTMTLDKTLRSPRPGKIRSAVRKKKKEWRKTERIPTQHGYQAHFIKVASPLPRLCCNIAHQHDTKRGAHVCGERLSLHRRLIVPPYTHASKFICVVICSYADPLDHKNALASWIAGKKKDNER